MQAAATWDPEFQKWRVYASRAGRKILTMQIAEKVQRQATVNGFT